MFDANYNPKPAFFAVQTALGGSTLTLTNPGPQHGIVGVPVTTVPLGEQHHLEVKRGRPGIVVQTPAWFLASFSWYTPG